MTALCKYTSVDQCSIIYRRGAPQYRVMHLMVATKPKLYVGVKQPKREADHSPHIVQRLRIRGVILPHPQYVLMARCLIKQELRLHDVVLKAQGQLYLHL
jgi:hypothetical protein